MVIEEGPQERLGSLDERGRVTSGLRRLEQLTGGLHRLMVIAFEQGDGPRERGRCRLRIQQH